MGLEGHAVGSRCNVGSSVSKTTSKNPDQIQTRCPRACRAEELSGTLISPAHMGCTWRQDLRRAPGCLPSSAPTGLPYEALKEGGRPLLEPVPLQIIFPFSNSQYRPSGFMNAPTRLLARRSWLSCLSSLSLSFPISNMGILIMTSKTTG